MDIMNKILILLHIITAILIISESKLKKEKSDHLIRNVEYHAQSGVYVEDKMPSEEGYDEKSILKNKSKHEKINSNRKLNRIKGGVCPPNYFACANGKCIQLDFHCDFKDDCGDHSDEIGCKSNIMEACPPTHFSCKNKNCIPLRLTCDYVNDCGDRSDENYCGMCGKPAVSPTLIQLKIVGGTPAIPHSWPWQISLWRRMSGTWYHICGGSIITKETILSAAHCFFENNVLIPLNDLLILAGDHDQSQTNDGPTQVRRIERISVHKKYNSRIASSPNDIALLTLTESLDLNAHVSTICLPRKNIETNNQCFATGWGLTKSTGATNILNQVHLPIIPLQECRTILEEVILDSVICAGDLEGGKDSCQGDSGGPLACWNDDSQIWTLDGIVSWGPGCAEPNKTGVYTRVHSFLSWIDEEIEILPI